MPRPSFIIFWLLLAATLCVDAVAIALLFEHTDRVATAFFFAMAYSQLGVLCVWSVLSRSVIGLRWLLPFGGGVGVGLVLVALDCYLGAEYIWHDLLVMTAYMWLYAALVLPSFWLLKPSHLFAAYSRSAGQRWQFDLKDILAVMTFAPVLILVIIRSSIISEGLRGLFALPARWTTANALLLLASAIVVQTKWHSVLRLAAVLGIALLIGAWCDWTRTALVPLVPRINLYAYFLIQAVVIWAWLETLCASHAGSKGVTDEIATAGASQ